MSIGSSKLSGVPQTQKERLESLVKLLLLWVAASDGELEESELEFISSQFPDGSGSITTADFMSVIRDADVATIEKAVRTVSSESRELRTAFLDMAIAIAMADRDMDIAENLILRFYADALHLGIGMLEKRFKAITGKDFPEPGDPSSQEWWENAVSDVRWHNQEIRGADAERPDVTGAEIQTDTGMTIARAQTVLGVSLNATQEDIERAYQNLAGIFQVDRVEAMGEAAVSVANARFRKIQQAYQLLRVKKP